MAGRGKKNPPKPSQGKSSTLGQTKDLERSAAPPSDEKAHQQGLDIVVQTLWGISCWATCTFFAAAVFYTITQGWKLNILHKSEVLLDGVIAFCGVVLYAFIEGFMKYFEWAEKCRKNKQLTLSVKQILDYAVNVLLVGYTILVPNSTHGEWHAVLVCWGGSISCVATTVLGRVLLQDPSDVFSFLTSAFQPLTIFFLNDKKIKTALCVVGVYVVTIIVVFPICLWRERAEKKS